MVRVGIIGAGHFAKAHVEALSRLSDRVQLAYFARRDETEPFPEAQALGATAAPVRTLIDSPGIDAVLLCVPNNLHRRFAEAALGANKHVFCEKPMALTVENADAMVWAASRAKRVLMVGHLTRYMPVYLTVASALRNGGLGPVRGAYLSRMHCGGTGRSWRMDPHVGGGAVYDLLVHDFDLMNWYFGPPKSVFARGRRHSQGAYHYIASVFAYNDEFTATVEGGFILRPPCGLRSALRIVCERGHIEVDTTDVESPVRVFEEDHEERRIPVKTDDLLVNGLVAEFGEFFDAIDGNPRGRLRPEDARQAVACAEAVVQSCATGAETAITPPLALAE